MARPTNADASQTQRAILLAAIDRFGHDGFHGATIRQIAADAGVTLATVHHYFGAKDDLLERCLEDCFALQRQIGEAIAVTFLTAPADTRQETAVRQAVRATREHATRFRFLLRMFVFESTPAVRARTQRAQRESSTALATLLAWPDAMSPGEQRAALIGLGMLLARFAAGDEAERRTFGDTEDLAWTAIEDYIVRIARATLPR